MENIRLGHHSNLGWRRNKRRGRSLIMELMDIVGRDGCVPVIINNMDTYHAAHWSDISYSSSEEEENRYRITHHQKRTKQCDNLEQRVLDSWTWEEILEGKGPWAQAGEYRRPKEELEAAKAKRQRIEVRQRNRHERQTPPKKIFGGTRGVWQNQVGDLSQLPVLTVTGVVLVRHRVMRSSAQCLQCVFLARCATSQPPVSAMQEWVSSQGVLCRPSVFGLRYAVSAQGILRRRCVLCLRVAGRVQ
ncbi:uncharacterized protein LOC115138403 isoform X2 [Oncorhynchus nerka]|uniref:uncharacterized protein LOC115138403 isoform X2 n=1 Tax=Oncorhynchus nerka TaxID=8023 RepID=UPI0031B85254